MAYQNQTSVNLRDSLMPQVEKLTSEQLFYAQQGLGKVGSGECWELLAEEGQMRLYSRAIEIEGLVCDPLKAVTVVKGVTAFEVCHRFFVPETHFDWDTTLEAMNVVQTLDDNTLLFHQVHKRIWPAAQRDALFWSHIRKIRQPQASCLSGQDVSPLNCPDLRLLDVWTVCNNSTDKIDVPVSVEIQKQLHIHSQARVVDPLPSLIPMNQLKQCVRVRLTVSMVCETYIDAAADMDNISRDKLTCKIIYIATSKLSKFGDLQFR